MRLFKKIVRWTAIALAGLLTVLLSLSFLLSDKVVNIFLTSVNRQVSTTILVEDSRLSLLRRFPRAAVTLRDVTVLSSTQFDKTQFGNTDTDTLLSARSAILEFSMSDIIKGIYNIESLIIDRGRLNLFSDSSGRVNYEISADTLPGDDDEFVINLEKVIISGLDTRYINTATSLDIAGSVENGRIKSRIAGKNIDFICNGSLIISKFDLFSASVRTNASVDIDLNLHQSDSGILFRKGTLKLEDFRFGLTGFISFSDMLDLKITGQNIDIARIKKYLPEKYIARFTEYSPFGILKTECSIKGIMNRMENPGVSLSFSVEDGSVRYSKSNISISKLSFTGSYTNGKLRRPESGLLNLNNVKFGFGSATWSGDLKMRNLSNPRLDLSFSGEIIPSEILKFFPVPDVISSEGSFRLNLSLSGSPVKKDKYTLSDFVDLNPEAEIEFNSFGMQHKNENYSIANVEGNIVFARNLKAEELFFSYKGQRFRVSGEFTNLPAWIAGKSVKIKAAADITALDFDPLQLMIDTAATGDDLHKAYELPAGVDAIINFKAENLVYKKFRAGKIEGRLVYKPGRADFQSLKINALNGTATGEFFIAQNSSKSFLTRGSFNFENIDVNLAFKSFNNFGQDFLVAENIEGSLSGNLSLLIPFDSLFNADIKAITAEGKYLIENGKLLNFEPVKALSGFIELSELENISFSRLENDLFIRNNYLAVPQMDIKSSAADFTVNGKHSFDYTYEYHVKTYLSEILSKKAKKGSKYSTEFGAIEEDGLGRTSIYLKVTGDNEDIKVVYDLKAAGSNIKKSLRNEKGNIKSILNEEYGLFKGDTTVAKKETAPKPKYRIEFSETDSVTIENEAPDKTEEKGLKRIFKKKKGTGQDS